MFALFTALFLLIGAGLATLVATDGRRRRAREHADDLEAARLRLVAAGEDPDAVDRHEPDSGEGGSGGNIYASRHAVDLDTDADADLDTDPDEATVIEHVAPGAGSLTTLAAAMCDTREMRTNAEQRHLEAVYDEAHDEDVRRDLYTITDQADAAARDVWAVIDAWVKRYHGKDHYANCVHCEEALREQSDEFEQVFAHQLHDATGEISKADIEALYAPRPVAA